MSRSPVRPRVLKSSMNPAEHSSRPRKRWPFAAFVFALGALLAGAPANGAEVVLGPSSPTGSGAQPTLVPTPERGLILQPRPSSYSADTAKTPDVIFVPTPEPVVDKMLQLARPKKTDVVYDLGCGDGRIVVAAAKRFGTRAIGFDIDPNRVAEARENVRKNNVEHLVTIEERDIFTIDLAPADVVTLYLLPRLNVKLIPQLEKLKAGSRVVSHDFDMKGVQPQRIVKLRPSDGDREHLVYLFNVPLVRGEPAAHESGELLQLDW